MEKLNTIQKIHNWLISLLKPEIEIISLNTEIPDFEYQRYARDSYE